MQFINDPFPSFPLKFAISENHHGALHRYCIVRTYIQRRRSGCTHVVAAARSAQRLFAAATRAQKGLLLPAVKCLCTRAGILSNRPVGATLPISNLAYARFSSLKVRAAVVIYTLAEGFAAARRSACMPCLPVVPPDSVYVRFCSIQILFPRDAYVAQHCEKIKDNPRSHSHFDPYTVSQETNLLT